MLPEITSSGLSHTLADVMPKPEEIMRFIYLPDTFASSFFINKNYGRLDIRPKKSEVALKASVRDINGTEVLRKDYTMTDLSYNKKNFAFPKLCVARVAK